ncbi:hypothetical protein ACIP6X_43675 [Streptomyces coeruleorubidus]|uniref:hypothetical protein n=1 Tax=Streptomyces coeruleorubidus TaxID=116188 RepID=UPI0038218BF6
MLLGRHQQTTARPSPIGTGPNDDASQGSAVDPELRKAADQRARQLAGALKHSRIPRREPSRTLVGASAGPDAPTPSKALAPWMKTQNR